jgi:hypothetical protein
MVLFIIICISSGSSIKRKSEIVYTKTGEEEITQENVIALVPELDEDWGLKYSDKYAFALAQYHGKIATKAVRKELTELIVEMVHDIKSTFGKKYRGLRDLLMNEGILKDDRDISR